jgi:triacylglycerol lipase
MRRQFSSLLILVCFVMAGSRVPTGWAAEPAIDCVGLGQKALDLPAFRQVVDAYAQVAAQPQAASDLLVCLRDRGNRELAETLLLHQRCLRDPKRTDAEVERAFLHYVINTKNPKLADGNPADLERLAQLYRSSLLLKDVVYNSSLSTLDGLRQRGQWANQNRYGRKDVVPVHLLTFDASAVSYSIINATWMAEMAALAYRESELSAEQLRRWGYSRIAEFADRRTDTYAFLAAKDNTLILSFRGTSGLKNFLTDANALRVRADWLKGTVHDGFKSALNSVWPEIVSKIGPHEEQQNEIWLTGHSLGAALAQLAALRLTQEGYRVHNVYTFGTPRVGDRDFVADYDQKLGARTFPHVNHRDIVTRVPLVAMGYLATASVNIREFTGGGHKMKASPGELVDNANPRDGWTNSVKESIQRTTDFLPDEVRPQFPVASYATSFMDGPVDDHGSYQYLFKLVCASIEYDLWPREERRLSSKPDDSRRK